MDVMLVDVVARFGSMLEHDPAKGSKEDKCLDLTLASMKPAALHIIAKHIIGLDKIARAHDLAGRLREVLAEMVTKSSMFSDERTRKRALKKVAKIRPHIACPSKLLNDKFLSELYGRLQIKTTNLLLNVMSCKRAHQSITWKYHGSDWLEIVNSEESILSFEAFYSSKHNYFYLYAPMVNELSISLEVNYVRYGTLGVIIGHEMSHAFGIEDRHRDEHGRLVNWWDPDSSQEYFNRQNCIRNQYNGTETLNEDMADNMGFLVAYRAYSKWLDSNQATEKKLPGFAKLTERQLFWLNLATVSCNQHKDPTDQDHNSPSLRVNQPLKNFVDFSNDFGCKCGQSMNPEQKCIIW